MDITTTTADKKTLSTNLYCRAYYLDILSSAIHQSTFGIAYQLV